MKVKKFICDKCQTEYKLANYAITELELGKNLKFVCSTCKSPILLLADKYIKNEKVFYKLIINKPKPKLREKNWVPKK